MRLIAWLGLLGSFAVLGGCIKDTRVAKLNADGSGTITATTLMKNTALEMMREMAKAFGDAGGGAKTPDLFSEEEAKAKAAKMGEGVEFVSFEKLKTADEEGMKVVYSFKDITKVKISDQPETPEAGGPAPKPAKKDPITFKFAKQPSGNLLLTIVNPQGKEAQEPMKQDDKDQKEDKENEAMEAQLGQAKELLAGLKVSIQVEVAGKIVKTNSPHVSGSTVTILEMDFDKFLGDASKLKKLMKAQPKSLDEAKALIKDFPGVKVNRDPEITVEFAAP